MGNLKYNKIISWILCIAILFMFLIPMSISTKAVSDFEVYYSSQVVGNGDSVHYKSRPVTIGIQENCNLLRL